MNTILECLDILVPDINTIPAGKTYTARTTRPVAANDHIEIETAPAHGNGMAATKVTISQFTKPMADAPRAVKLRNPEKFLPQLQQSWAILLNPAFSHGAMVTDFTNTTLGINWKLELDDTPESDSPEQANARELCRSYLRNLIHLDFAQ